MTLGAAVYAVMWWVVLFAVLPWGVVTQMEAGRVVPGSAPSAPARPAMGRKVLITSGVTALLWLLLQAALIWGPWNMGLGDAGLGNTGLWGAGLGGRGLAPVPDA